MNLLRSLVFTSLLDLDPGFGRMEVEQGSKVVTEAAAWVEAHPEILDIHEGVRAFLATRGTP